MLDTDGTLNSETASAEDAKHDWWPDGEWLSVSGKLYRAQKCGRCTSKRVVCGDVVVSWHDMMVCK